MHPHMLAPLLRIRAGNRRLRQNVSHKRTFLHHMGEPGRLKVELSQKNVAKSAPLRYAEHMDNRLVGYARAFVESAVNQIISRRFVKKQQMRWTKRLNAATICYRFVPESSTTNGERRWRAGIPA